MRLGVNSTFSHNTPLEWAKQLRSLGCSSAVFPVTSAADEDTILRYRESAQRYDLTIAEVGIWKNPLSPDPLQKKEATEFSVRQLKLADRIGAKCCVNVAGAKGPVWDGPYRDNFSRKTWEETVSSIREIIDRAEPAHTFFTIEPLPWMYPTGPEEYLELIREVDRAQFAVHMDLVNMINCPPRYFFNEDFIDQCFDLLGPYIKSCHIKDVLLDNRFTFRLNETACGKGFLNLEHYVQRIEQIDPQMPVLIEHLGTEEEYRESLSYLQQRLCRFCFPCS